jgi:hypothetical protein
MPDFSADIPPELALILSPAINFAALVIIGTLGMRSTNKITSDMVVEAEKETNFKHFTANVLTQAGVVSALLLSIEIPMTQLAIPDGFERGTVMWDVYFGTCFLSCGFSVQGVFVSVLGLGYIQGLSSEECLNFLANYPESIGFAISTMATGAYLLILQTTLYFVITASSCYMVAYVLLAAVICIYNITSGWIAFSSYENKNITPEHRMARKKMLGLEKSRTCADWISSWKKRKQREISHSSFEMGFILQYNPGD